MTFDDIWEKVRPSLEIMKCGGFAGMEEALHMREIYLHIVDVGRIRLKPDGTYTIDTQTQAQANPWAVKV